MTRPRHYEAVAVRRAVGAEYSLGDYTTARAALNGMALRAAFGPAGVVYRVRDKRTGKWLSEVGR